MRRRECRPLGAATRSSAAMTKRYVRAAREALERFGKSLFFGERNWPALLNPPGEFGVPVSTLAALGAWLPAECVDQKRPDALAMLAEMGASKNATPVRTDLSFRVDVSLGRIRHPRGRGCGPERLNCGAHPRRANSVGAAMVHGDYGTSPHVRLVLLDEVDAAETALIARDFPNARQVARPGCFPDRLRSKLRCLPDLTTIQASSKGPNS